MVFRVISVTCHVLTLNCRVFDKFPLPHHIHFSPTHAQLIACCKLSLKVMKGVSVCQNAHVCVCLWGCVCGLGEVACWYVIVQYSTCYCICMKVTFYKWWRLRTCYMLFIGCVCVWCVSCQSAHNLSKPIRITHIHLQIHSDCFTGVSAVIKCNMKVWCLSPGGTGLKLFWAIFHSLVQIILLPSQFNLRLTWPYNNQSDVINNSLHNKSTHSYNVNMYTIKHHNHAHHSHTCSGARSVPWMLL